MRRSGIAVFLALSVPAMPQHGSTTAVNPYTGPQHAEAGAKLFRAQCAGCHGPEGAGTAAGPSLTTGNLKRGGSDEELFQTISKGVPGTAMPAFSALSGLQVWQLVTHMRALARSHGTLTSKGDARAGEAIFRSNCTPCHALDGSGRLAGPDLAGVAARRSPVELRQAVSEPDADVPSQYWSVSIRTRSGQTLRGIRLNEDSHSYQLHDERGRLVSVLKRDVAGAELIRRSPMSAIAGKLSDKDIDNVVAYLMTLRRER